MNVCRVCTSNVACRYREKGALRDELRDIIEANRDCEGIAIKERTILNNYHFQVQLKLT